MHVSGAEIVGVELEGEGLEGEWLGMVPPLDRVARRGRPAESKEHSSTFPPPLPRLAPLRVGEKVGPVGGVGREFEAAGRSLCRCL